MNTPIKELRAAVDRIEANDPPRYKIVDEISEVGRNRQLIECDCGARVWVFVWSWSGHGIRRCPACRSALVYGRDHKIDPSETLIGIREMRTNLVRDCPF